MSHTKRMEKIQIVALIIVAFGLFALSIPMVCSQLIPAAEISPFEAPGRSVLNIETKGRYIIYLERFLDDDKPVQEKERKAAGELKFLITPSTDLQADPLGLESIQNEYVYRVGRRKGVSLYSFDVPQVGTYVLRCYYPKGRGPTLRMSLGESSMNSAAMRKTIVSLIVVVNVGLVIAVLFLVRKMLQG